MIRILFIFIAFSWISVLKGQEIDGLVARYTFNNNKAKDDIGGGFARVNNVSLTNDRFGNPDFAYYFLGNIDSYINLGTHKSLKPKTGSISIWVKINMVTYNGKGAEGNPIIYTKANNDTDFNEAYAIGYNFSLMHLTVNTSLSESHQAYVHPDKTTSLREWHHVVMTYDNNFLCMYLDGTLEGKVTKNFETVFLETDSVMIGVIDDTKNVRFLFGSVDDLEIYNRVLSAEEVLKLYNAPNPNRYKNALKWVFLFFSVLMLIALVVRLIQRYVRKAIHKEKENYRLQNQWIEQENKILAVQMNPHFIFNSLNTIQQFIFVNDNEKAQLYLSKFSRLIRKFLENNTKDYISLTEEIELCEKYLEIESLRFNNVFSYTIAVKNPIDVSAIKIPHFLIQPFIENAIWHGLLPKRGGKFLSITFELINEKTLSCTIEDNGVGRAKAGLVEPIEKKKSLAINFIKQRLLLYSKLEKTEYKVQITDKLSKHGSAEGTQVVLTIPIINN